MADSTESNNDIMYLGLLIPTLITLIAGLVIHSFIIGVNVTDWWKGRSVTPVDLIVTSLGISRICAQFTVTLCFFMDIFSVSKLASRASLVIIGSVYNLFSQVNFWLTSLFSIVLYLKISNFHTRLFLYLRGVTVHRTVYFIGASLLLSAVNSLGALQLTSHAISSGGKFNTTMDNLQVFMDCMHANSMFSIIIGAFLPFLFSCISSVLLFTSLYHHITKMKMSSNLSINLETYYSVMKLVSFTFLHNTIYSISHLANALYYYFYCEFLPWVFFVSDFLPVLHSSYLIYRTAKLRSQMSKVLQNVTDFIFQREDAETRENIEVVAVV